LQGFAFLPSGCGMFLFLKQIPAVERLIRRNPLFYREFRALLDEMEQGGLEMRRAAVERLRARAVRWARVLPGYGGYDFALPFGDLPLLSKSRLQNEPAQFQRQTVFPQLEVATSGTTGQPLRLKRSLQSMAIEQAMFDWMTAKAGLDFAQCKLAILRGDEIKDPNDPAPPYWVETGDRKIVFSSMHLNSRTFPEYARKLQAFKPDIITAYPSSLDLLTNLAEAQKSPIAFKLAITSSETLVPGLRARVRDTFGARLLDYYGQTERSCAAYSFVEGAYHFIAAYAMPELLPDPEGRLSIVGTPFWNRAQPLLRYDIGDIAVLPKGGDFERITLGLDPFLGIEGRRSDFLRLADGTRVFGLDRIPSGIGGVASVQIVQVAPNAVLMVVVPNTGYSEETLALLRRKFYLKVPQNVDLRIDLRDTPYRLPSGKAPVFISHVQGAA
jgi:phenylacetate-CoA ligase